MAEKSNNSTELVLGEIPGVESRGEVGVEMPPLCAALRYNTFFKSLVIDHVKRKVRGVCTLPLDCFCDDLLGLL